MTSATEAVEGDVPDEDLAERTAHEHEFDDVARWTAEELVGRDRTSAIAGASRGSGSPSALAWLGESLRLEAGVTLLDVGSGLGGPAAWAEARFGVRPVGVEPMPKAAQGAGQLFDHPSVVGRGDALPFADGSFETAWTLGVLDTLPDAGPTLREIRRCLVRDGRFGVLAYVADAPIDPADLPEGNRFASPSELVDELAAAGFAAFDQVAADSLPDAPLDWTLRQERVEEAIARRHGDDPAWAQARENEAAFGALLEDGRVSMMLVHAVCI